MEHAYKIQTEQNSEMFVFNSGEGTDLLVRVVSINPMDPDYITFNLSLGVAYGDPWLATTKIDFEVMSNKGDVLKVMNTVALWVEMFLEKRPDAIIFFTGSTEKRTRVYQKLISRNWKLLHLRFIIKGMLDNEFVDFEPDKKYSGIAFAKKIVN